METEKIYFTKIGYNLYNEKLKRDKDKIAEMLSRLGYLAEVGGDQYHDNFSYEQQTMELRMLTKKVGVDEDVLKQAIIINSGGYSGGFGKSQDTIFIGSTIVVRFNGDVKTWEIVGYGESDPKNYKIAYNTPLGTAFMGKHKGESFNYAMGSKDISISIINIK